VLEYAQVCLRHHDGNVMTAIILNERPDDAMPTGNSLLLLQCTKHAEFISALFRRHAMRA
jgi:hypothetical protein